MDHREWLTRYADALGLPHPADAEIEAVLALAAEAAHASERPAAPVACWLAARAGVDPGRALETAKGLTAGP